MVPPLAVTEIGPTCRLCERDHCRERAAPPVTRTLVVDELSRSVSPAQHPSKDWFAALSIHPTSRASCSPLMFSSKGRNGVR